MLLDEGKCCPFDLDDAIVAAVLVPVSVVVERERVVELVAFNFKWAVELEGIDASVIVSAPKPGPKGSMSRLLPGTRCMLWWSIDCVNS